MTWDVVITSDEPEALIVANVAYHLATGAEHVHVYLDRPDDPAQFALRRIPGATVTLCDDAHWANLNDAIERPPLQMRRQTLNANHALSQCSSDWIFSLDADEFLRQDRPLDHELPYILELGCELHIPVWERFYRQDEQIEALFQGAMRGSTKDRHRFDAHIFGEQSPYLILGQLGHGAGKCAIPAGSDLRFGLHRSIRGKSGRGPRPDKYKSTTTRLFHFDGLTPLQWIIKLLRYAMTPPEDLQRLVSDHRRAQIKTLLETAEDRQAALNFHDSLKVLPAEAMHRLRGFGLLDDAGFDPLPEIRQILPSFQMPSAKEFDAQILARYPEVQEIIGD